MAATSQCSYDAACETPCTDGAAAGVVDLLADEDRRRLLAVLTDLEGTWLSVDDFVVHVDALDPALAPDGGLPGLVDRTLGRLEAVGLAAVDEAIGRFRYHGCPLVGDLVASASR